MKTIKDSYDYSQGKKYWTSIIKKAEDIQLRFFGKINQMSLHERIIANGKRLRALRVAPIYFDLAEGQIIL